MARFDLMWVDRIEFKLVLAEQWSHDYYMHHNSFSKYCANRETHSFADIYTIRILDKGNNHSLPALL